MSIKFKSSAKTAYGRLGEIKRLILAEPLGYDQNVYRIEKSDLYYLNYTFPKCNTICCVAGWEITLAHSERRVKEIAKVYDCAETAQKDLGLTLDQSKELFEPSALSKLAQHKGEVLPKPQTLQYAKLGYEHITNFQHK